MCEPRKPEPPVTRTRFFVHPQWVAKKVSFCQLGMLDFLNKCDEWRLNVIIAKSEFGVEKYLIQVVDAAFLTCQVFLKNFNGWFAINDC